MPPTFSRVAFLVQATTFSSMDYSRIILIVLLSSPPAPNIAYSPRSSQDVFLKHEIREQHSDTPTALRIKSQLLTMAFKTSVSSSPSILCSQLIPARYVLNAPSSHSVRVLFTNCFFCLESSLPCLQAFTWSESLLKCHFLREAFPDLKYHSKK